MCRPVGLAQLPEAAEHDTTRVAPDSVKHNRE
jgi:hypothetical protein